MFKESETLERPPQSARPRENEHHHDVQLFSQDRYRQSKACLLFPVVCRETVDFMKSLNDPPGYLASEDLLVLDDHRQPSLQDTLDQLRSTKLGNGPADLSQRMFPLKHLQEVLWHCRGRNEHYLAQNAFKTWQRSSDAVHQLTSCWVDLDYYKLTDTEIKSQLDDDDEAVELILRRCFEGIENRWFKPSQIIRSGRGIYVKWVFNHFLPGVAAPRWRRVMETLIDRFKDFGADPAARDAARVLRVTGSRNSKSKTPVRVLHDAKPIGFDDLAVAVLERERASFEDRQATKKLAAGAAARFGVHKVIEHARKQTEFDPANNWPSLVGGELKQLARMRGHEARGHVELITFLVMNFKVMADQVHDRADFDKQVKELGELMHASQVQLLDKVANVWSRHQAGRPPYRFKKRTVIDRLEITQDELKNLPCLAKSIGAAQRKPTQQTKDQLTANQQRARLLEQSGINLKSISQQLKINPRTVKRWLVVTSKQLEKPG